MDDTIAPGMSTVFTRWADLTDAYARQLTAMQQGEPGARAEAARLAREIQAMLALADTLMAPTRAFVRYPMAQ